MKEFTIPTNVYAASYLPDKNIFVCGGEDFVIYRYEYSSGEELGMFLLLHAMHYYIQCTTTFNLLLHAMHYYISCTTIYNTLIHSMH